MYACKCVYMCACVCACVWGGQGCQKNQFIEVFASPEKEFEFDPRKYGEFCWSGCEYWYDQLNLFSVFLRARGSLL